ncbi:MAG TPA: DPP IV N-terminal domain-containing protein [Tepidisphaeraceae bacterium]|nr:DPP IV N-terminal domain-containing protein [Tepidisphaeraceae bacterium]
MTIEKRKTLTWILSGAAAAMVLASAGCASSSSKHASFTAPPMAETESAAVEVAPIVATTAAPVSKVNIFGEIDGTDQGPMHGGSGGFQQQTFIEEGADNDVSVDPKGEVMVFSSTRHSEHANIYLQRVNGLSVTQLTSDDADCANPSFSPDGSKIAFCSMRSGNWDIYEMDADGKNVVQITNSPMQEIHPSFSPDGSRVVYSSLAGKGGQWELWVVNLNTGEKKQIGFGLFPTWSPNKDKDQIAFQKARARGSRWFSLWTLDLVDGQARRQTEVAVSSNAAIVCPTWSPDGKKLTFSTIVEPTKDKGGQQDVWTINADGTNRHRVTDGNGTSASPFWAAGNRIYFVSNRNGTDSVWSVKADENSVAEPAQAATHAERKEIGE